MPGSDNSSSAKTQMSKPTDLKLNMSEKAPMVPISSPSSAGKPGFVKKKKKISNFNAPFFFLKCNVYYDI